MKKDTKFRLLITFITLCLIIIILLIILNEKNKNIGLLENTIDTASLSASQESTNSDVPITVPIQNKVEEQKTNEQQEVPQENESEDIQKQEEHIYGYDENAMQVEESYDGFSAIGFLEIPKINLALPVLSNQTVKGMNYSCCFLYTNGEFNLSGNSYIVGHNYNDGTLFSNIKQLSIGDEIIITGLYKNRIVYTVYNAFVTSSTDVSYLTKEINENNIELSLQCCYENENSDLRFIVEARHEII